MSEINEAANVAVSLRAAFLIPCRRRFRSGIEGFEVPPEEPGSFFLSVLSVRVSPCPCERLPFFHQSVVELCFFHPVIPFARLRGLLQRVGSTLKLRGVNKTQLNKK